MSERLPPMTVCVNCKGRFATMEYAQTCSKPCHAAYIEATIARFGPTKRVQDAATGKVHLVPTRDICERGITHADLPRYPEAPPIESK